MRDYCIFDGPSIIRERQRRQRRIPTAIISAVIILFASAWVYQEVGAHSTQLSITDALEIVGSPNGNDQIRRQAHFELDKIDRQSCAALVLDAARRDAIGRGSMIRLTRRATDIIQALRELANKEGEVGSSARLALQKIAEEASN